LTSCISLCSLATITFRHHLGPAISIFLAENIISYCF